MKTAAHRAGARLAPGPRALCARPGGFRFCQDASTRSASMEHGYADTTQVPPRGEREYRTADRLWAEYPRTHDPATRDAIIRQFQPLAYSLAHRFARPGLSSEDLCQVALIGLVKAVDRFDP